MDIKDFITTHKDMNVEVSDGVSYSLRAVINENYRLWNARFENPEDASGLTKIFYRMIWVIWRTIVMSSDVDLKDLNFRSLNGKGIKTLALLKLATRSHLLRTFFGKYIDSVEGEMVWHGSSITKRADGSVYKVDLRNYLTEPNIQNPQERSHVEYCYYTYDQMMSYKNDWKDNWTAIEELWEKMKKENISKFTVLEYWTWDTIKGEEHKVCKKYLDRSLTKPDESRNPSDWNPYLELDTFITPYKKERVSERLKEKLGGYEEMFPYEQADFFECPGRFLAFGCGELLAGLQEHYNEQFNLKRKKDILDLRGIFTHKYTASSNSLTQEFLDNLETGDVVSMDVGEDLQRLIIDTKTAEFIANVDKLYELMRLVMGVTAQGTGEELPGSTSASGIKANFATQQTTYDFVRERMHHFVQGLFMNGYFEDILEEITAQEMVAITGSPKELLEIDKPLIEKSANQRTMERYNAMAKTREQVDEEGNIIQEGYITWDEAQMIDDLEYAETQKLVEDFKQMGDTRWAKLKKELFKGLQYIIEFFVTSETFDKQTKLETYRLMLADPNFTGSRKAVEDAIFDLTNENPRQFDKTPEEKQQEVEQMRQQSMNEAGMMTPPNPMGNQVTAPMGA